MTANKTGDRVVKTCTHAWYEIVERNGELTLSEPWAGEWEQAAAVAGIDLDDGESWVCVVEAVDDRHDAIESGDYCCCQGIGSDVVFVRLAD